MRPVAVVHYVEYKDDNPFVCFAPFAEGKNSTLQSADLFDLGVFLFASPHSVIHLGEKGLHLDFEDNDTKSYKLSIELSDSIITKGPELNTNKPNVLFCLDTCHFQNNNDSSLLPQMIRILQGALRRLPIQDAIQNVNLELRLLYGLICNAVNIAAIQDDVIKLAHILTSQMQVPISLNTTSQVLSRENKMCQMLTIQCLCSYIAQVTDCPTVVDIDLGTIDVYGNKGVTMSALNPGFYSVQNTNLEIHHVEPTPKCWKHKALPSTPSTASPYQHLDCKSRKHLDSSTEIEDTLSELYSPLNVASPIVNIDENHLSDTLSLDLTIDQLSFVTYDTKF